MIIDSVQADFDAAKVSLAALPRSSRAAVMTSAVYYQTLLDKLAAAPIATIKAQRIRVATPHKLWLLARTALRYKVVA